MEAGPGIAVPALLTPRVPNVGAMRSFQPVAQLPS
jgi:hypothetical protein